MEDEEYPEYLKKESYDDLVSISYSIDKETQAKRYQMVLSELAERDKRGEKPKANWGRKAPFMGKSKYNKVFGILFGLIFTAMAVFEVCTGYAAVGRGRGGRVVSAAEHPITFWFEVGFQIFCAILSFYMAFMPGKK